MSKQKKTKRISKQMSFSIIMVIISLVILSISTYAWFLITNTPKVEQINLTADTLGDLKIANKKADGTPDTYQNVLTLDDTSSSILSPVTTGDGLKFYAPIYDDEGNVSDLRELAANNPKLHTKYIYEKEYFLKAGNSEITDATRAKDYDIFLVGKTTNTDNGSFVLQSNATASDGHKSSANALRISLTFESTAANSTFQKKTIIYEPNSDGDNQGVDGTNRAIFTYARNTFFADVTEPAVYKQKMDKTFEETSGREARSNALCTIKEGEDIKVTMKVWIEGEDKDCMNDISTDQLTGQIQFISEENLSSEQVTP